ncbi:MAG: RDD family protein [Halioglobus sp.]
MNPDINKHPQLPRRLAALVYDTCLVLPIIMACVALFMGLRILIVGDQSTELGEGTLSPLLVQAIAFLSVTGFFSWFWLRSGQTLGMQAWRVKLVSYRGQTITPVQALLRCIGAACSAICLGMGYWWCLIDPNKRYWHDYLSGTELILMPKTQKNKEKSKT